MRSDTQFYNGIADCLVKMYKNEGLGAFWKGIVPPILVETPKRAVKVFLSWINNDGSLDIQAVLLLDQMRLIVKEV